MTMIKIKQKGDFKKTEDFLKRAKNKEFYRHLDNYAKLGVQALKEATPVDSGVTADSWSYDIKVSDKEAAITWTNSNTNKGENIAILIQYGHGTGTGGYVRGQDYINPAMKSVFEKIIEGIWKEVSEL